jgi:hypothetical protein
MSIEARIGLTFDDVWKMFQETDKKIQETAEEVKETTRAVKELSRTVGGIDHTQGKLMEEMYSARLWKNLTPSGLPSPKAVGKESFVKTGKK